MLQIKHTVLKVIFVEILINYLWKDDFYSNEFLK